MTQGLVINATYDSSVSAAPAGYKTAIAAAIQYLESQFTDPITVNIAFGWGEEDGSHISGNVGQSQATPAYYQTYATIRAALAAHATSADDAAALAVLPATDPLHAANYFLPNAQQKALGLLPANGTALDGYVGLNSSYSYTFDPANRAVPNSFDAIGVLEHEITEDMGRTGEEGSGGVYTLLDLFRYSSPGVRGSSPGPGSFSINGQTLLGTYNNPNAGGDAVDWTPSLQGDSFGDAYYGTAGVVTPVDLREMDVIGYDSVDVSVVQTLYAAVLGRAVDTGGNTVFTGLLAQGTTAAQVRTILANSAEAQADIVGLYQTVLGRTPDPSGLAGTIQYLASNGTLAQLRTILSASPEAAADIGAAYQAVLGRTVDGGGLASFEAYLGSTGSLQGLRTILAGSAEGQSDIAAVYGAVLGRAADPGGLAAFTTFLANPTGSLAAIRSILAGSAEATNDIGGIYTAVLGRAADPGGLAAYVQALATGTSLATVRSVIASGAEAATRVTALLQADEGHTPTTAEIAAGQVQLSSGLSLADLNVQTLQLAHNPIFVQGTATVTASPNEVLVYGPGAFGQSIVTGFNPANDMLQLSRSQFPTFGAVVAAETSTPAGLMIAPDAGDSILLQGVAAGSLNPSNIRFV